MSSQCVQHHQCGEGSDWGLALGLAGIGVVGLRFVYVIKSLVSTTIGHYTELPMQNNIVGGQKSGGNGLIPGIEANRLTSYLTQSANIINR